MSSMLVYLRQCGCSIYKRKLRLPKHTCHYDHSIDFYRESNARYNENLMVSNRSIWVARLMCVTWAHETCAGCASARTILNGTLYLWANAVCMVFWWTWKKNGGFPHSTPHLRCLEQHSSWLQMAVISFDKSKLNYIIHRVMKHECIPLNCKNLFYLQYFEPVFVSLFFLPHWRSRTRMGSGAKNASTT